jgi:hypothetical protein
VQGRGTVDYLLRTQQQNQIQLVLIADQKANIVLTVALLMITVSADTVFGGDPHPALLVLVAGALLAALPAIMALMPSLGRTRLPVAGGVDGGRLFFGTIARMDADSYRDALAEIAADDGRVYDAIAADLHAIARVLQRKYLWLRRSYLALLATLGASGLVALASLQGGG